MKISLCITHFNRFDMLVESFAQVIGDDRISEIVIVDDCSDERMFNQILEWRKTLLTDKIFVYRNIENLGVYHNKYRSVELATNDWVIVFDSDNIISPAYLDTLFNLDLFHAYRTWDKHTLYSPDFGIDEFDFTHFSGHTITKENVAQYIGQLRFDCLINLMNCFMNRNEYLSVWKPDVEPVAADSIYMNYLWLSAGNKFYVVPGLQYVHRVHGGSHYVNHSHRSNFFHADITNKLKMMR